MLLSSSQASALLYLSGELLSLDKVLFVQGYLIPLIIKQDVGIYVLIIGFWLMIFGLL